MNRRGASHRAGSWVSIVGRGVLLAAGPHTARPCIIIVFVATRWRPLRPRYNSPTVTHDRLKTKLYIYVTQETKNNLNLCHREYISPCRERDKTWSCMHSKPLDTFSPGFRLLFLITTSSDGRCCRSAEMPLLCLQPWHSSDSILSRPDGTTYICPKI